MPETIQLTGQVSVSRLDNGHSLIQIDTGAGRVYTVTLERDLAEGIGKALTAPSVALPGNGQPAV